MKYYNVEVIVQKKEEYERIKRIIENEMEWAIAYHDKDTYDDGSKKPPHYHIQIYGNFQKTISAWSKYLKIEPNFIEKIKDKKQAILYLTHRNKKEKYQYPIEIIESNFDVISYYEEKRNEIEDLKEILKYIEKFGIISYKELFYYTLQNNLWSTYRRNYSIIKDFINEKNILTKSNMF